MSLVCVNQEAHRAEFLAAQFAFLGVQFAQFASAIEARGTCVSAASIAIRISNVSAQDDLTSLHNALDGNTGPSVPNEIVPECRSQARLW
jgi:hypothetical protein